MTRDNRSDVWLQPLVISALQSNGRTEGAICYAPLSQLETERAVLADAKREGNLRIADLLRGMDSVAGYLEIVARELDSGHARVAAESLRRRMAL